ncbi:MAG: DUF371 domain-containing protein [Nitrosarchaeum sp.]|nr:DUF371 domain-containing protein [Nitrosarchaeum sp.]MCA9820924.1 DUF371 domain-containing protein [Nitrosarchaeum sp.]
MIYEIEFSGHENIRSNHARTIEITKDSHLTPRGDCIVGVNATSGCADLPFELKEKLKDPKSVVSFFIKVGTHEFVVHGNGDKNLTLTHTEDIVIRKSNFVCPRTLAVRCDKASDVIPREMIALLQNPNIKGKFIISVS